MEAPKPAVDDLPEKPFLDFAEAVRKMDTPKKEVRQIQKVAEKPAYYGSRAEKPAYTPPAPKPIVSKPQKKVDLSRVKVGCKLRHKAFGTGTVKKIDSGMIVVAFGNAEKKFQFPGALLQGFLSIIE